MHSPLLRIGTRGSPLALAQAHEVRDRLAAAFPELAAPDAVAITVIRTTGDAITDRTLSAIGGLETEDPATAAEVVAQMYLRMLRVVREEE